MQGGGENAADTYAFFDGQLPPQCTTSGSSETTTQKPTEVSSTPVAVPVPPLPSPSASLFPTATGAKPPAEASNSPSAGTATSGTPQQSQEPQPGAEDNNNPEESPSIGGDSDSNSACFPSDATVQLPDGTVKQMAELQIGDRVKVAPPDTFSEVFFFSHNHKDRMTTSVKIETSINGIGLTASPGHMLYANGKRVPASAVRVGDEVSVSHDSEHAAIVTSVQRVETVGLHNPHTLHGDIVVDGVVASTYTTAVHPVVAWMALAPFRAAYHAFGASDKLETLNRAILRTLDVAVWE